VAAITLLPDLHALIVAIGVIGATTLLLFFLQHFVTSRPKPMNPHAAA